MKEKSRENCKKFTAEFLATAALVFLAVGAVVFSMMLVPAMPSGVVVIIGALAFGLVIVAMAYAIGPISGAHLNPAVSLGMWIAGRMKFLTMLFYMLAQTLGAIFGAALLYVIKSLMTGSWALTLGGTNAFGDLATSLGAAIGVGLIVEVLLTFVFVFTIIMVTSRMAKHEAVAGVVIGLTLTLVHLIGISLTGTSVNPARSIGPAIFGGVQALQELWLFIVAPLAGAALAALVAKFLLCVKKKEEAPAVAAKTEVAVKPEAKLAKPAAPAKKKKPAPKKK